MTQKNDNTPRIRSGKHGKGQLEQQLWGSPATYSRALAFGSVAEAASRIQGLEVGCFTSSKYVMGNENRMDFPSKYQKKLLCDPWGRISQGLTMTFGSAPDL